MDYDRIPQQMPRQIRRLAVEKGTVLANMRPAGLTAMKQHNGMQDFLLQS